MSPRFLLTALLLSSSAVPAFAVDRLVPEDFPTIQDAVNAAGDGDVVILKKGKYPGPVLIVGKTGLELRGNGSTIDGAKKVVPIRIEQSRDVKVTGFKLVKSSGNGVEALDSDDVEVSDCTISKPIASGVSLVGVQVARVLRNKITKPGLYGVFLGDEDAPTDDALVEGNAIKKAKDCGINAFGERNTFRANTIKGTAFSGIFLTERSDSSGRLNRLFVIEDNIVSKCKDHSIFVGGENGTIRRNNVTKGTDDGLRILGSGHTIEDNTVTKPGDDCFFIDADDCQVRRNIGVGAKDDGFEVDGDGSTFEDNTATKSKEDGFDVDGTGNTFRRNTSTTAKGNDLDDSNAAGANTYEGSNEFETTEIG